MNILKKIINNIIPVGLCKSICKLDGYHYLLNVQQVRDGNWKPANPIKRYKAWRLNNGCLLIFAHEQEYKDELLQLQWKMEELQRLINESENVEFDKDEPEDDY